MELLSPSFFPVHFTEDNKHGRFEFQNFFFGQFCAAIYLIKYSLDFSIGIIFCIEFFNTMVRQTATLFCEEVVTFAQSSDHIIEIGDSNIANFCQLFYITTEISRDFYSHSLIRTPSWQHLDFKSAFTCFDVIFQ